MLIYLTSGQFQAVRFLIAQLVHLAKVFGNSKLDLLQPEFQLRKGGRRFEDHDLQQPETPGNKNKPFAPLFKPLKLTLSISSLK